MSRVLVTGASGFVGRHVAEPLARRGYELHAVSRHPPDVAGEYAAWHQGDLLADGVATEIAERVRPTHLLHLAWLVTPGAYQYSDQNERWTRASLELLRAFAGAGGRRAVLAGSCLEYGPSDAPCVEGETPTVPANPYTAAKRELRSRAVELAGAAGLSLTWARIFYLYGPHEHPRRLVPSIASAVLAGRPAPISDGEQVRDFLYAPDAGDAMAAVLDNDVEGAVNVASGEGVEVRRVAELTATAAGRPELLRVGELERHPDETDFLVADVGRLRDEVGWRASTPLEEGIARTVEWWRHAGAGKPG